MAFMQPVAEQFINQDDMIDTIDKFTCEYCGEEKTEINYLASGECCPRCTDCFPFEPGWYARLSASGYLDATDWDGPHKNAFRALRAVCRFHEVDLRGDSKGE